MTAIDKVIADLTEKNRALQERVNSMESALNTIATGLNHTPTEIARKALTPGAAPKVNTYPGTYWMIECSHGFTGWWKGSGKVDCRLFDKDPTKGKRFATKQEAEAAIQHSCQIATEHMDCAPGAAPKEKTE